MEILESAFVLGWENEKEIKRDKKICLGDEKMWRKIKENHWEEGWERKGMAIVLACLEVRGFYFNLFIGI